MIRSTIFIPIAPVTNQPYVLVSSRERVADGAGFDATSRLNRRATTHDRVYETADYEACLSDLAKAPHQSHEAALVRAKLDVEIAKDQAANLLSLRNAVVSGAASANALVSVDCSHRWLDRYRREGGVGDVFIENGDGRCEERESDEFAMDQLIPPEEYAELIERGDQQSPSAVRTFARQQGIAGSIIVGRLQHDRHVPLFGPESYIPQVAGG